MGITKTFLALMGATLLSANALADPEAPSLVNYDVNGDGTIAEGEKAYELKSADDLYWFMEYVNNNAVFDENAYTYLTKANAFLANDITVNNDLFSKLNEDGIVKRGEEVKEWFPIGYYYDLDNNGVAEDIYFCGTFDGNGHTISGLYFNNENQGCVGLFGQIDGGATIKNVGVIDSYFKGKNYIGGVCGYNYYGTIANCYNTGEVSGGNENIGGVCGYNYYGTIEKCYNTGKVSGGNGSYNIGGVCGNNNKGTIEKCYNIGKVSGGYGSWYIGGVCGNSYGTIENCYNSGKVSGGDGSYNIGGVCGYSYNSTITNCYNSGKVSGGDESWYIGGVCGYNDNGTIKNCYYLDSSADKGIGNVNEGEATAQTADQFADGTVAQALREGTNGNVWGQYIGVDKSPKLTGVFCPKQITEGEYAGYYAISNADELYWFSGLVNGKLIGVEQNTSANAVLTANITINKNLLESLAFDENGNVTNGETFDEWFPIGNVDDFCGTFDGNGNTISGLYVNNEELQFVGFIGSMYGATIKNVGVVDSYIKGKSKIGGVCGYNYGDGTITNCYNSGKVSGGDGSYDIGGVCGLSFNSTITNCYNAGEISGGNGSYDIGGVCGYSWNSTITNCYDFKLNSGTLSEYSIVVENNTIALPTEDMVSREGYQFDGWYNNTDCEGDGITSEAEFSDVLTRYAKWTGGSTPTAIKAVEAESNKTIKTIKDGQIVIIRNGVMYDMQGRKL